MLVWKNVQVSQIDSNAQSSHDQAHSGGHLLGGWVVTRPFTER
jgi:hypothetical protein